MLNKLYFQAYLDRYRDIKFTVVTTSGDEFFLAEDTHAFWNDLRAATQGSAMLRRLPNAEVKSKKIIRNMP
jgi:PhoPQ-activated pathogenicity-related protein